MIFLAKNSGLGDYIMSHANGVVMKGTKAVGYFEYDGTVDVAVSAIWSTREELEKYWRSGVWKDCECGKPPEEVVLYTEYGGGFHWPARICFRCGAIVDNLMPPEERTSGLPPKLADRPSLPRR